MPALGTFGLIVVWLVGWLDDSLVILYGSLVDYMVGCLLACLLSCLVGWLVGW